MWTFEHFPLYIQCTLYTDVQCTCSVTQSLIVEHVLSLPLSQDWFSGHLKQLVMELGRSGAGLLATDGASMSMMSSHLSEEEVTEPERAPLDLTE